MRILIAVPTFENICPEVFKAIYDLDKCGHDVDFEFIKGYDCAKARNVISKKAIDGKYDYLMMLDSDTIIPKDGLKLMLEGDAHMVMGCVPKKVKRGETVLFASADNPMGKGFHRCLTYADLEGTERIDLKGGGFGCVLIRTEIFAALKYPYFKYVVYEDGAALSEDLYFCRQARDKGFRIEADTRIRCGHIAKKTLYE